MSSYLIFEMFPFHSCNYYYSEFMVSHALTSFKCWTMVNWVLGSYLWMVFFNVLILITQNSWLFMLWLPLSVKLWWITLNTFLLNTLMYHYSEFMYHMLWLPINLKLLGCFWMCHSFIEVYIRLSFIRRVIGYLYPCY